MAVEEKAKQYAENIWGDGNDASIDQIINSFLAGYKEAKPKEVTICPFCNSTDLKWAFRFVKKCKTCNEVFPCE